MNIFLSKMFFTMALLVALAMPSLAQEEIVAAPIEPPPIEEEVVQKTAEINPETIPSVLFMFWEHSAIKDAKRARGLARPPSEDELAREIGSRQEELRVKPPAEERDITLGGIVYHKANDWTIWLNGKRVTPDALPEEVIDLRVFDEYIELKWYDNWTNQIFPLRMKAHQRFNIDTRIFLPG